MIDLSKVCSKTLYAMVSAQEGDDYKNIRDNSCGIVATYKNKHGVCSSDVTTVIELEPINFQSVGEKDGCNGDDDAECTTLKNITYNGVKFKDYACVTIKATELSEKTNGMSEDKVLEVFMTEIAKGAVEARHRMRDKITVAAILSTVGEDEDHVIKGETPTALELRKLERGMGKADGIIIDRGLVTELVTTEDCAFNPCASLGDCEFGEFTGAGFRGCAAESEDENMKDTVIAGRKGMVSINEYIEQNFKIKEDVTKEGVCYKVHMWVYFELKIPYWSFKLPDNTVYDASVAFAPENWEKQYDGLDRKYAPAMVWKKEA